MTYNRSLENIILSSVKGKDSSSVLFKGPKGTLKLVSSEIIIREFLPDYDRYIPFNHTDIYLVGTYYYELLYKFFLKVRDELVGNEMLRKFFESFVGMCIAHRKLVDEKRVTQEIVHQVTDIRQGKFDVDLISSLMYNMESVVSKLSKISSIGIDVAREIVDFVSRTSLSGYKFIVISEFDNATIDCQNAMLKILEEPPKGTFFVLTTSHYEKILPTIKSRTFTVSFLKLKGGDINYFSEYIDSNRYYTIYDILIDSVYDIESLKQRFIKVISSNSLEEVMRFSEDISQDDILTEKFFEIANTILRILLKIRGVIVGLDVEVEPTIVDKIPGNLIRNLTIGKLEKLQSYLDEAYRNVYVFNMNPKFVITSFLLEVFS
ncbi:MAG: hypothetical protein N2712_04390 [Brevinematales bacterium]|nr:hypothetical protein [Brevinematales bacterium]